MPTPALEPALTHDNWRPSFSPWLIALTVAMAAFMEVLDTSIANVALPHMAGALAAGPDESTWVLTSYLVANAIILPLNGWLSAQLGRKRYFMLSMAGFTVASALCGIASSLGMLVFFRVLQGLFGGGLQPGAQAILADSFELKQRGMAFALYGVAVVCAPALGPTLGGWITDNLDWRWIFWINIPVGLVAIPLAAMMVEDPPYLATRRASNKGRVDYIGLGFIALGLGSLQYVLDTGQQKDWFADRTIVILTGLCVIGIIGAIIWELWYAKHPIVDLRLFKERNFATASILMFLLGCVLLASTVLLPMMLQTLMGYTATQAGMVLSPGGVIIILILPFVGQMLSRGVQPRLLIVVGLITTATGLFFMGQFSTDIDFRTAVIARLVQSSGLAFLFVPINTVAYAFLPPGKNNDASGMINLMRNVGGAVGIAFVTTMVARDSQTHQATLIAHATPYNPVYTNQLSGLTHQLIASGLNAADAAQQAVGMIYGGIQRQAAMLAYVDNFKLIGLLMLAIIPAVFMMKRTKFHHKTDETPHVG